MSEGRDVSHTICHISARLRPIGRKASELDHSIIHIYRNSDTFKSFSKLTAGHTSSTSLRSISLDPGVASVVAHTAASGVSSV